MNPAAAYASIMFKKLTGEAKRLAPWGAPAGIVAVWFVYPALTDNFKKGVGLPYDASKIV